MKSNFSIQKTTASDAHEVAVMAGELLDEIMRAIGVQAFNFNLDETSARLRGSSRGWKRLEVTTPPLPQFDRTLAFYEKEGFAITGGRKLKVAL